MRCTVLLATLMSFVLARPSSAALQAPDIKPEPDLGNLFSDDKKPCTADAAAAKHKNVASSELKGPAQSATPLEYAAKQQTNQDNAVAGLIKLGVIPADKPSPVPTPTALGTQAPMGSCQ